MSDITNYPGVRLGGNLLQTVDYVPPAPRPKHRCQILKMGLSSGFPQGVGQCSNDLRHPHKILPTPNQDSSESIKQRLQTLEELQQKGLHSEEVYQHKRQEILEGL